MRDPVVALYVVLGLTAIAGSLVAARRRGLGAALLLVGMNAVLWAVAVLAYPLHTYFYPAKA
jgi:hypothetical protein